MNDRIYQIRMALNKMSQEKFGEKLGVSKAAVSRMEMGKYGITETMIKLICTTFNVSETWFRTGEGEMFEMDDDEHFSKFLGSLFKNENSFKKKAVRALSKLNDDQWEMLECLFDEISKED